MIPLPRGLLVLLATGVAGVGVANGFLSFQTSPEPVRVLVAIALFAVCFVLTVVDRGSVMSPLVSGLNAGSSLAMALLCTSAMPDPAADGPEHWYIGAVGCLLVLTMLKRRPVHAWIGAGLVLGQALVQSGWSGALDTGAAPMVLWVAAAWFGVRSSRVADAQAFPLPVTRRCTQVRMPARVTGCPSGASSSASSAATVVSATASRPRCRPRSGWSET